METLVKGFMYIFTAVIVVLGTIFLWAAIAGLFALLPAVVMWLVWNAVEPEFYPHLPFLYSWLVFFVLSLFGARVTSK